MTVTDEASVRSRLQLEYVDPRTVLLDQNVRLDTSADVEFVDSIRTHGILQPPAVVRTVEGNLRCKLGHRRTVAAIAAGLAEYPVLIAGDEATDDPGMIQRVLEQLVENDARAGLTGRDRVHAVEQLAAFGLTADQIARRTKRPAAEVQAAIVIAGSESARNLLLEQPDLDLTQAALLAEFADHPDEQARVRKLLTGEIRTYNSVAFEVQRIRDDIRERTQKLAAAERAGELGIRVVDEDDRRYRRLDGLSVDEAHAGKAIPVDAHRDCPGHAAIIRWQYGDILRSTMQPVNADAIVLGFLSEHRGRGRRELVRCAICRCTEGQPCEMEVVEDGETFEEACDWSDVVEESRPVCTACLLADGTVNEDRRVAPMEDVQLPGDEPEEQPVPGTWLGPEWVCTDADAQGHVSRWGGHSSGSAPRKKAAEMSDDERAAASAERKDVIESNKGMDSAQTVRRRWLKEFLTRKTAPKGTAAFMLAIMADLGMDVDKAMGGGRRLAHELLGLGEPGMGRSGQASKLVEAAGKASDARAQVIALAFVLACCEDQVDRTEWRIRRSFAQAYFAFLDSCGYELADVERRVITGEKADPEASS